MESEPIVWEGWDLLPVNQSRFTGDVQWLKLRWLIGEHRIHAPAWLTQLYIVC